MQDDSPLELGITDQAWTVANQAVLVAEFARIKGLLAGQADSMSEASAMPASGTEPPSAVDQLAALFGLSSFERDVLLLCAGVEMDSQLAALCGEAQGLARQSHATFGLALAALPGPHWSALTPARPLRRFHLVELGSNVGLTSAPLRIDERILHYLAGINLLDQRLQGQIRESPDPEWIAEEHEHLAAQACRVLEIEGEDAPVLHLCGDDPRGQEDVAALAARRAGMRLFALAIEDVQTPGPELEQLARLWEREAVLSRGILLIHCGAGGLAPPVRPLLERLPGRLIVASRDPVRLSRALVRLAVDKPHPAEQKRLWERALGPAAASCNGALDHLSGQFRLSAWTIRATGALSARETGEARPDEIWNICRSLCRPRLEDLAERVAPAADWEGS